MFKKLGILIWLAILVENSFGEYDVEIDGEGYELNSEISSRNPKFFYLFPHHNFKSAPAGNMRCFTGNGECGRCLSRKQCTSVDGGNPTEAKCPGKNGICCLIKLSWNQTEPGVVTVKNNLTHITTSSNLPSQADFLIPRQKGICQLRLDFKQFNLSPAHPEGTGACGSDTMTIKGADNFNTPLVLCGNIGPNEHMYLHYGSSDVISINMDIVNSTSRHDIFVTMIKCDSTEKAPEGCTQYYTQQRGDVRSFNYPYQQLNNQHYSVCIQASRGAQSILWSMCNSTTDFYISGNAVGQTTTHCPGDRITIPGSVDGAFCGGLFADVQTSAKPFVLYVDFDHQEITPPGHLQTNGCPSPFECIVDGKPVNSGNYMCTGQCSVDVGHQTGVFHDMFNSGFCLRYMKT